MDSGAIRAPQEGMRRKLAPLAPGTGLRYWAAMESSDTFTIFDALVWGGAAVSLLGLVGLMWCVVTVWRARRAKLDDTAMRAVMQQVLPRNLGALFLSVIGLMLVIVGIFLS